MARIDDILTKARDRLVDHDKQRWSDARLLRLVDEAQKDIAKHSKILKGDTSIQLAEGQHTYDLPSDVWLITRAAFADCEIPLTSYDQMDEQGRKEVITDRDYNAYERHRGYNINYGDNYGRVCWELTEGSRIEYVIYDNRDMDRIRVYPIPNADIAANDYTFSNDGDIEFVGVEVFGVVIGIDDYTVATVFGVLTDLYDPAIATDKLLAYAESVKDRKGGNSVARRS